MWERFSSRCTAVETSTRSSWWSVTHSRVWTSFIPPHLTRFLSAYPGWRQLFWSDRVKMVTLFKAQWTGFLYSSPHTLYSSKYLLVFRLCKKKLIITLWSHKGFKYYILSIHGGFSAAHTTLLLLHWKGFNSHHICILSFRKEQHTLSSIILSYWLIHMFYSNLCI